MGVYQGHDPPLRLEVVHVRWRCGASSTPSCTWWLLARSGTWYHAYPSVSPYFGQWREDGWWHRMHDRLGAFVCCRAGRHTSFRRLLDRQSIKTTARPGPRGYDVGKHSTRQRGLTLVTRRWVVERTIAWLTQHRRLSEDEEQVSSSEAMIYIAMIRPMVRRLARSIPSSASF